MNYHLKYEFVPPNKWTTYIRQAYDRGPFNLEDGGTYTIKDGKLGLSYWNDDEVIWERYSIKADTLLVIEFLNERDKVRMVFKREKKLPEI